MTNREVTLMTVIVKRTYTKKAYIQTYTKYTYIKTYTK